MDEKELEMRRKNAVFNITDTSFLINMFQKAPILGAEAEQGLKTMAKIKNIHELIIQQEKGIKYK